MVSLQTDPAARDRVRPAERRMLRRRLERMARAAWLAEATERELEVAVRLTGDADIHALNRDYRGKDKPTDVLAFALREAPGSELMPEVLGDIVISVDTAERQAKAGLLGEILFLSAHGLCHLLGYDHRDDAEEAVMNQRMAALLAECERRGPVRPA